MIYFGTCIMQRILCKLLFWCGSELEVLEFVWAEGPTRDVSEAPKLRGLGPRAASIKLKSPRINKVNTKLQVYTSFAIDVLET